MSEEARAIRVGATVRRFDAFLSHNSSDKPVVERIAEGLKRAGLDPWLDVWYLAGGGEWQEELAGALAASSSCAFFIGPHDTGAWAQEELGVARDRAAKDPSFRLIPVLLPGLPEPFDPTQLPAFLSTRTWVDYRNGSGDRRALQNLINAIKGVPFGPAVALEPRDDVCPYRGLQLFDEEHAEFFFGRDANVQRLLEKLKDTRFLAVLGPSGSGKSSLVRAGLVPALREGRLRGSEAWRICVMKPDAHPLASLAGQLVRLSESGGMQGTLNGLEHDARSLHLAVSLARSEDEGTERVVLLVDQFEEVFTLCRDEKERTQFFANLLYAVTVPGGRTVVISTLRADFYPKCAAYPDLSQHIAGQQYLVSPLDSVGLKQAIEEPARRVGLEFEEGLVDTILDDVKSEPGALPLLEHALLELWNLRRGDLLTLEGYRESGGVDGAIRTRADHIYAGFTPEQQAIARRAFLRLTQPGEGTEDTRRRAAVSELVTSADETESVEAVVRELADARMLTTSANAETGERSVDVSHEALIRGWPKLRQWIDEDRAGLRIHRRLTESAKDWQHRNQDESFLYRGSRLVEAREWRARNESALNDLEREFLTTSDELEKRERHVARRGRMYRAAAFAVLLVAAAVGAFAAFALQQRSEANRQADKAAAAGQRATARGLGTSALSVLSEDPELSVLLAMEAVSGPFVRGGWRPDEELVDVLRKSLAESRVRAVLQHGESVNSAEFSPDGKFVVTGSQDGAARVWDSSDWSRVETIHTGGAPLTSVAVAPDGRLLLTADAGGEAGVWSLDSGRLLAVLRGSTGQLTSAKFSPDGRSVVTASVDGTARVWDTATGRMIAVHSGHRGGVWGADWSPDGQRIATVSEDGTASIWASATGRVIQQLRPGAGSVTGATFSRDGKRVFTTVFTRDAAPALIFSVATGKLVGRVQGETEREIPRAFSLDGRRVVFVDVGSATIRDTTGERTVAEFRGHRRVILDASFSPDARLLLTASLDGTARVWDARERMDDLQELTLMELLTLARSRVFRQMTPAERRAYMP